MSTTHSKVDIDMMSSTNLLSLPAEIHLKIGSYLTEGDLIPFSLASRRIYPLSFCQPQRKWTTDSLWVLMVTNDSILRKQLLTQWDIRLKVLPRLREWTKRVVGITTLQGESGWLRVCTGCACYRFCSKDWEEGLWFFDVFLEKTSYKRLNMWDREIVGGYFRTGDFCRACSRKWDNIGPSWDVGVAAS